MVGSKDLKPLLSPECLSMIESGVGYRTEAYSGTGVRDAIEVATFEMVTFGNNDIPTTLLKLYGGESEHWNWMRDWAEDEWDEILSIDVEEALEDIFANDLPIKVRYALWLAPEEAVKEYYVRPHSSPRIDAYPVRNAVVLSDLGYDGVLFGFEELPVPM